MKWFTVVKWFTVKMANCSVFVSWKTNFLKVFYSKLCFFNFLTFEFNIFNYRIQETKQSHFWNGSQLTLQTAHFRALLFDEKCISLSKFLQNYVCSSHFQPERFVFHLYKSSNIIKISFSEMSFAKIRLLRLNLYTILFHT